MSDKMGEALEACPFCGSEGQTLLRGVRYPDGSADKEGAVMCPTCEARAPLKAWNMRPPTPSRPVTAGADLATWLDEQIAEAKKIQIAGFAAGTQAGNLHGERSHARQCALYEAKQKALATPPSAQEQVFIDACNEAGCSPDNEALLQAIAGFKARITELETRINTPQTGDWLAAVPLEAAHQIERYGAMHDAGKSPWDWFWLIGYLAQKAADAAVRQDPEKAKHHTISTAAALLNWHRRLCGEDFAMRPGIADPAVSPQDGETAKCTICAKLPSSGFYTGCMIKDGHDGNGWKCDGNGNLSRPPLPRAQRGVES